MNRLSLILTHSWIGYEQILLCSKVEMAIARWIENNRRHAGCLTIDGKSEVRRERERKREREEREMRREREIK